MKKISAKVLATILCIVLLISAIPYSAFATIADWSTNNITYNSSTFGTNGYYNVISQKDYTLVPGAATETEMVLNNSSNSRRQVLHVVECDPSNPDISIIPGYYGIDKDLTDANNQVAAKLTDTTKYYEDVLGYNVVAGMNTALRYDSNYPTILVYNGVNLTMGKQNTSTYLGVYKDENGDISCMVKSAGEFDADFASGKLWQAMAVNFGFTVKNGSLVTSTEERTSASAARSMIGVKEDGTLVFVMNDGRGANNSVGFCDYELGESMLSLGCKWAVNCDGGGSSTFVSKRAGESVNTMRSVPCDGAERPTIHSMFLVSNVGATGVLSKVNISSDYDYFAPNTSYDFTAEAIDTHGYAMDMPADAVWSLSDSTFGTVNNGKFVSNGKLGDVDLQISSGGSVVGTKTIHIANPTTLAFTTDSTVIPYGRAINLEFNSNIGENKVYIDSSSFEISLSDSNAGTMDGLTFKATSDESASNGTTITATYIPSGKVLQYVVTLGKGSEVIWDFEDGIDGWLGQQAAHDWQEERGVVPFDNNKSVTNSLISAGQMNSSSVSETFLSTKENGGLVHNGNSALGVTYDFRRADFNSWVYAILFNVQNIGGNNEKYVLRDVNNNKKATAVGMWLYLPVGFHDDKNNGSLALQMNLFGGATKESSRQIGINMQYNGKNLNALTEADIPDSRWIYVRGVISGYNYVSLVDPMQSDHRSPSIFRMYIKPSIAQTLTYYYDDITLDYSDAVDDRDAPVISNPCYAITDTAVSLSNGAVIEEANKLDFSANAVDYTASNMTGLDASSAAVYVDGVKVENSKFKNGQIIAEGMNVTTGSHTVIFEISDNIGNVSQCKRTFTVNSSKYSTIYISGHNDSNSPAEPGSIYYIDIYAKNIDKVKKIDATIDLQTANEWQIEHMDVVDGFDITYDVNEAEPEFVTLHIKNVSNKDSGDSLIASIPVRVWQWNEDWSYGGDGSSVSSGTVNRYNSSYGEPILKVEADFVYGKVTYTDDSTAAFGNKYSVDTKLNGFKNTGLWHMHTATSLSDCAPTCTKAGYTGRTYCDDCKSVVDWGTDIPALGHSYEVEDGVLKCKECGELFTGEYTDGKTYKDGVVLNGWVGKKYYADGVAYKDGQYTVDGLLYDFDNDGNSELYSGFYKDTNGWRYFSVGEMVKGFVAMEDGTYYFSDNDGYAPIGEYELGGRIYKFEGEKGKCLGAWGEYTDANGNTYKRYYYSLRYLQNQFREIDGKLYYFNNLGYMQTGKRAIAHLGEFVGAYEFGEKGAANEGQYLGPIYGPFLDSLSGKYFFGKDVEGDKAPDGTDMLGGVVALDSLCEYNGNYYFAKGANAALEVNASADLTAEQIGDYGFEPGTYKFDSTGKMVVLEGPVLEDNGVYYNFYIKNKRVYNEGLYEYDGNYYYVRNNGLLATWPMVITEEKANGLVPAGEYSFASDGKMILTNGPVQDPYNSSYWNFYINGKRIMTEGLYEYNDKYYYVRSNGLLLTWGMKIDKMGTTGLPAGEYLFNDKGELQLLNGPVQDAYSPSYWNFYKDGIRIYDEGLYEYNGKYYYVRSNGLLLTWGMKISKMGTTGLPAGEYLFNEMGELQLLNGPVKDSYNPSYWNFYKDGIRIYEEGLYEYNDKYYYVRSNGLLLTWGMKISKMGTTGLPAGEYLFNDMGELQLLNGPVKDSYNPSYWNFYKNGIRIYDEGLYEYNGKYYYVRSNGLLLTWGMYINKMGDTGMPAGEYSFNENGEMQLTSGPVQDAYNPAYYTFYINGVRVYEEGLYEYNGDYYYVRNNGLLLTWGQYINKMGSTGLEPGDYQFASDGKMVK